MEITNYQEWPDRKTKDQVAGKETAAPGSKVPRAANAAPNTCSIFEK